MQCCNCGRTKRAAKRQWQPSGAPVFPMPSALPVALLPWSTSVTLRRYYLFLSWKWIKELQAHTFCVLSRQMQSFHVLTYLAIRFTYSREIRSSKVLPTHVCSSSTHECCSWQECFVNCDTSCTYYMYGVMFRCWLNHQRWFQVLLDNSCQVAGVSVCSKLMLSDRGNNILVSELLLFVKVTTFVWVCNSDVHGSSCLWCALHTSRISVHLSGCRGRVCFCSI